MTNINPQLCELCELCGKNFNHHEEHEEHEESLARSRKGGLKDEKKERQRHSFVRQDFGGVGCLHHHREQRNTEGMRV